MVGPSHRGPVGRIVPGSVGERLLHGAPCPVAVAPRGYSGEACAEIKRIGVGYTAGPEAGEALSAAVGLAARMGAALRLLSVVEPSTVAATLPLGWGFGELEATEREISPGGSAARSRTSPPPLDISGEVVDGYADDELARLSREVDLLICGSRGHGPIGSVTLGNASTGVLRKAHCPVLVVPRGARDGFAALRAPPRPSSRRPLDVAGFPQGSCARLRRLRSSGGSAGWTHAPRGEYAHDPSAKTRG